MALQTGYEFPGPAGVRAAAPGLDPPAPPSGLTPAAEPEAPFSGVRSHGHGLEFSRDNRPGREIFGAYDALEGKIIAWPQSQNVGNVADPITVYAYVWNTFRQQTATLATITASGTQGIENSGLAVSDTLAPTLDVAAAYMISPAGPVIIAASYLYTFDLGAGIHALAGTRGVALLSRPRTSGYSESWSFDTEIFRAMGGKDYARSRFALGDEPRARVAFPVASLNRFDRARLQNTLQFAGLYNLAVPLWWSLSRLAAATDGTAEIACPTAQRRFLAGRSVLLLPANAPVNPAWAVRSVETVEADGLTLSATLDANEFAAGDLVVPLISASLANDTALRSLAGSQGDGGTLEFEELA